MSDFNLQGFTSNPESQFTTSQQKFDALKNERFLHNLILDYVYLHDRCFGRTGGPEADAKWEALFTSDAVTDLHPLGTHHGQEGKMNWAQSSLGGRGQGCQIVMSNIRIVIESVDAVDANAQSYATVTVIPDDVAHTMTVKGQYDWKFRKVDGAWKVARVTLSPFPKP